MKKLLAVLVLTSGIGFVYGFVAGVKKYPPYGTLKAIATALTKSQETPDTHNPPPPLKIDQLVEINTKDDVDRLRGRLIRIIWGNDALDTDKQPDLIENDIVDPEFSNLPNLQGIDRLTTKMAWGLDSVAYHFIPETGNNELAIYCQGHLGGFHLGHDVIARLLQQGYAVIAMSMPLKGMNSKPVVDVEGIGRLKIADHNYLEFIKPPKGHVLQYFVDGPLTFVNYAMKYHSYSRISMLGISGGGWTTTVYAAIDPRVARSYPVAGSEPITIRSMKSDSNWGDFEQIAPEVYTSINYLEMYLLGSSGPGRKQLQILNKYDPCCFGGDLYRLYEHDITQRVASLGSGAFEVYQDASHREHKISTDAIDRILQDLDGSAPAR